VRLVIRGARVLAPDALSAPHADLLIEGESILAVLPPGSTVADAQVFDAADRLIIPGLVNGHTHSHGGLAKGSGDKWDLALLLTHGGWISGGRVLPGRLHILSQNLLKSCVAVALASFSLSAGSSVS